MSYKKYHPRPACVIGIVPNIGVYDRIEEELRSEGIDPWKPIGDKNK